jgi:hypothetical protein
MIGSAEIYVVRLPDADALCSKVRMAYKQSDVVVVVIPDDPANGRHHGLPASSGQQ